MKYLRLANTSDLIPAIYVLGLDYDHEPWKALADVTNDDPGGRIFGLFDEGTTLFEAPVALANVAYAVAYAVGMRGGICHVRLDDCGRPEIQINDEWYLAVTHDAVIIYR